MNNDTPKPLAANTSSAIWTPAAPDTLPEHTNWVLIVIDGKTREVPDHIGLGWRKRDSAGRATGWWETNKGLMMDKHIKYWAETPALPNASGEPCPPPAKQSPEHHE